MDSAEEWRMKWSEVEVEVEGEEGPEWGLHVKHPVVSIIGSVVSYRLCVGVLDT